MDPSIRAFLDARAGFSLPPLPILALDSREHANDVAIHHSYRGIKRETCDRARGVGSKSRIFEQFGVALGKSTARGQCDRGFV